MTHKIRIFTAEGCQPCIPIKELVEEGRLDAAVELIDISSPAGLEYMKQLGLDEVPAAYKGSERCQMRINEGDGFLNIICPSDEVSEPVAADESRSVHLHTRIEAPEE